MCGCVRVRVRACVGGQVYIYSLQAKEAADQAVADENIKRKICGILDPVTSALMSFDDEDDLLSRIDDIYTHLDTDGSGGLTFEEFRANVRLLPGGSKIRLTHDDFDVITEKVPAPSRQALHELALCSIPELARDAHQESPERALALRSAP